MIAADVLRVFESQSATFGGLAPEAALVLRQPPARSAEQASGSGVQEAREAVATVGGELWGAADEDDFDACLSELIERGPWPSVVPLLDHLWAQLAPEEQGAALWARMSNRAILVFGPDNLKAFFDAVIVAQEMMEIERRLSLKVRRFPSPALAPGETFWDVFFQSDFPQTLREALMGGFKARLCAMATLDAMLRGERVSGATAGRLLATLRGGAALHTIVGAGLLGDEKVTRSFNARGIRLPTAEELVEEGRQTKALVDLAFDRRIQAQGPL